MKISTVVSFCSLDKRFIKPLLEQVTLFCDDIIVVYYDKLLNGTPEPIDEMKQLIQSVNSDIKTLCLEFTNDQSSRYFHNLARWNAKDYTKYDRILFLDGDEIPDGNIMKSILDNDLLLDYDVVDFKCYWYFRSAINQATTTEHCALLVDKKVITQRLMFTEAERWSFKGEPSIKSVSLLETEDGPIFHHFSWVRTKEEMIQKVSSWGHKNDRDWISQIEEEFSREFNGIDFVHNYRYTQVQDRFNLGL